MENIFSCPDCQARLNVEKNYGLCPRCERKFYFSEDIWQLLPKNLEKNKTNEDKLHFIPDCDVFKYNREVWRCLVDLAPHLQRFERETLPLMRGKKGILELACGNGWASALVKLTYPQAEVYASDVSPTVLTLKTKKLCQVMGAKIDYYIAADAENLPFTNETFDFVFIIASLHHLSDISRALKEVRRVLTKGGRFVGIDGCMPVWYQRLIFGKQRQVVRAQKYGILEKLLTYRQWEEIIREAGLSISSLRPYTNPGYVQAVNNPDEAQITRFLLIRELFFRGVIGHLPQALVKFLCKIDLLPAGIIIDFKK